MKMVGGLISTWVLILLLFVGPNGGVLAISCQDAIATMLPCQGFLMGVSEISVPCCQSAQSLSRIANSNTAQLTSLCQCLKQAAAIIGINVDRAQQIPQLCHIDLATGLIDPNVDCTRLSAPTPSSITPGPDQISVPIISPSLAH